MKRQHWTVVRRHVSHPAAEQRWDQAYRLLLSVPAAAPDVPPAGAPEGRDHACSPIRPRVDEAPTLRCHSASLSAAGTFGSSAQAQTADQQLDRLRAHAAEQSWSVALGHVFP